MIVWTILKLYVFSPLFGVVGTTGLIGVLCLVLFFVAPAWLGTATSRTVIGVIGICCFCGGSAYWVAFHQGESFMALKIAARDAAAQQKVDDGQKEVEACNGGIDWNVVTGSCGK